MRQNSLRSRHVLDHVVRAVKLAIENRLIATGVNVMTAISRCSAISFRRLLASYALSAIRRRSKKNSCRHDIVDVTWIRQQDARMSLVISQGVGLHRPAVSRGTNDLPMLPFPPVADRYALSKAILSASLDR